MEEKRKYKRLPIDLFLEISNLFKQDNVKVSNIHAPIEVIDISKSGIGFYSESVLPVGFYFNARLKLGDSNSILYCVIRIVRQGERANGKTKYGCEFVGMAPILNFIFDEYEDSLES